MDHKNTMQEIASELNLSRFTVSLVLNGKAAVRGIPERTIHRVHEHIKRRGYVPSRQALALRSGQRSTIGIFHCGRLHSHLTEAFNRMIDQFSRQPQGLEIMVVRRESLVEGLRELVSRGIKSLIWIHTQAPEVEFEDEEVLFGLLSSITTVIYNYRFGDPSFEQRLAGRGVHLVGVRRKDAYAVLARFLKSLGHRRVAFADVSVDELAIPKNRELFSVFGEAGLDLVGARPSRLAPLKWGEASDKHGFSIGAGLLETRRSHPFSAACFSDDEVAAFAMVELLRQGIRIPADLTVTGFDGISLSAAFPVSLTTLRMPVMEMVRRTVRVLEQPPSDFFHRFEMELVLRASHAAPGAALTPT